ncbi:hypothetical protein FHL15_004395 [Xylaria flabelliformis]|uniref:Uncharacterized protein n=1 Tax=Xylaria flabelliformis TaxID=2512241 RepID=A0A553I344_9PEZI|nr:hypothetical protein FHL15_004395 [Xylaria flabelliformis]
MLAGAEDQNRAVKPSATRDGILELLYLHTAICVVSAAEGGSGIAEIYKMLWHGSINKKTAIGDDEACKPDPVSCI